jgi:hypothetical protein
VSDISAALQNLQLLVPTLQDLLSQYFTAYADTTKCASVLLKFTNYMDAFQYCVGGNCTSFVLQRVNIFA